MAEAPDLHHKADQVFQKIRVVLPGTEALLGFQFVVFFNGRYPQMPREVRYFHLANLLLVIGSTVLLMAPVAYHQIKESGRDTNEFLKFSSVSIVAAMVLLLLGLSGDTYVATELTGRQDADSLLAISLGVIVFCFGLTMWYFISLLSRKTKAAND